MSLFIERWSPFIGGLIACLCWKLAALELPTGDGVLGSAITLGALFSAFITTYKALLISANVKVMNKLIETGYIEDLHSYLTQAMWLSIFLSVVSFAGFFVKNSNVAFGLIWIFTITATFIAFIRLTKIMSSILKRGFVIKN